MKWFIFIIACCGVQLLHSQEMSEIYAQLYSGNANPAILQLEMMVKSDTTNQELYAVLAQAYTRTYEDQKAIVVYERLHSLDTSNVESIFLLSKLLLKQGHLSRSMELVNDGLNIQPLHKGLIELAAKINYDENNYQDAFSYYSILIENNMNVGRYRQLRARCGVKMDRTDIAISDFQEALTFNPTNQQIIYEYAHYLYSKGKNPEALNLIKREADNFGGSTKYERLKGNIFHMAGEYSKALESYTMALDRGTANAYLLKRIGICHYELESFEKSKAFLSQATLLDAANPTIYYYRGKCEMELGNHARAVEYFSITLKRIQPSYLYELYINMAQCYEESGNPVLAIQTCRKGLEVSPDDPHILYQLANIYNDYYLDKSIALSHYEKAAEFTIHPEIDEYIKYKIRAIKESQYFEEP